MSAIAGYGRGYYGEAQLARDPRRGGSVWIKVALVVGAGAVIWFLWPRSPKLAPAAGPGGDETKGLPPLEVPPNGEAQMAAAQQPKLLQAAASCGYPGQTAYENAVVTSARQLQATGAKVMLAPHLAHLTPRLEGREDLTALAAPGDAQRLGAVRS